MVPPPGTLVGLDFETYGSVDLTVHGLDRYVSDPNFRPLIASGYHLNSDGIYTRTRFNFIKRPNDYNKLASYVKDNLIGAQNAGFEAAVLNQMGIIVETDRFVDSAVVARANGAGSRLEAAAPQLLGIDKMEEGWPLIKLFSIPGPYQERNGNMAFDPQIIEDHPDEWATFMDYCDLDAELGYKLIANDIGIFTETERKYQAITMRMNQLGWPVDLDAVEEMQRRYLENQEYAEQKFASTPYGRDLNLASHTQLVKWCAERGVRSKSFDEKNVQRILDRIYEKLEDPDKLKPEQAQGYAEVMDMLETKQILGGSSLKKLQTILDTVGADGRLRDQYMHGGAGQTMRTTGRSVQMQNLKRIGDEPDDMSQLNDPREDWDNQRLARNIRQVFTSKRKDGRLVVGDFSSVEARCLAWLAKEDWKLEAFRNGEDVYKRAAARQFNRAYDDITKTERQFGKVGELSCGYNAGWEAVRDFAAGMGVKLSEDEATTLVIDWRASNPAIVKFWSDLQDGLMNVMRFDVPQILVLNDGWTLRIEQRKPPKSLQDQEPDKLMKNIVITVLNQYEVQVLKRVFVGCYLRGKDINFFKPSDRKTGKLWLATYKNPKTKQEVFHKIYGGKLAGILTQSLCREIFFQALVQVDSWCSVQDNIDLIGQFHDEIVVDWWPSHDGMGPMLRSVIENMTHIMSTVRDMPSFPMAAEVKSDYRYTK